MEGRNRHKVKWKTYRQRKNGRHTGITVAQPIKILTQMAKGLGEEAFARWGGQGGSRKIERAQKKSQPPVCLVGLGAVVSPGSASLGKMLLYFFFMLPFSLSAARVAAASVPSPTPRLLALKGALVQASKRSQHHCSWPAPRPRQLAQDLPRKQRGKKEGLLIRGIFMGEGGHDVRVRHIPYPPCHAAHLTLATGAVLELSQAVWSPLHSHCQPLLPPGQLMIALLSLQPPSDNVSGGGAKGRRLREATQVKQQQVGKWVKQQQVSSNPRNLGSVGGGRGPCSCPRDRKFLRPGQPPISLNWCYAYGRLAWLRRGGASQPSTAGRGGNERGDCNGGSQFNNRTERKLASHPSIRPHPHLPRLARQPRRAGERAGN
uniref:Uncharacterized protein n=1 Tax=Sphaerodactylus townsendi TaxID=933632 RepID=A0ACB8EI09_9SAUR